MTGFKNFLLRGNLIETAVALIMALAFAAVVSTFTAWLMSLIPGLDEVFDPSTLSGQFLNALLAFLVVATVVYFFIVMPYTKAKERFFPSEEPGEPADVALLTEIRDLLAQNRATGSQTGGSTTGTPGV
jgi:large conductance mechanosensitive channel